VEQGLPGSRAFPAWDGTKERPVRLFALQIDNNSDFKSPDVDLDNIDPFIDQHEMDNLIGGVVYWRVKAIYDIGETQWSNSEVFRHNIEPELVKEIPSVKLKEDGKAEFAIDLNNHFTDDLWAKKLNYTIIEQEKPDKVEAVIEDEHFISIYTREENWYGSSLVKIKAADYNGLTNVSNKFTITVVPENDAPTVADIPDQPVTEDTPFILDLAPFLSDVDNNHGQLTVETDSSYITTNGLNLTLLYTLGATGSETVSVTVSDLRQKAYATFDVSITPVNDDPIIKRIPDRTMEEDSPLSFSLIPYAKDEENLANELTWAASGGSLVTTFVTEEGDLTLTSEADQSGSDVITLTVTDKNGASDTTEVTVVVLPVNDPPEILPIEEQEWPVDEPFEKNLEAYVSDVDNLKSELMVTSDSQYVTSIVGFTITIEYPLDATMDEDEVTISVSDGIDHGSTKMTMILKKPPRFVNTIPDMTLYQGETKTLDLKIFADDDRDDQDQLIWSITNKGDKNLVTTSVKNKNTLTFKGSTAKAGATTIKIKVTDSEGFSATQDVRVTVKESAASGTIGSQGAESLLVPIMLLVVLVAMVTMTVGYRYKLKKDRIARIRRAQEIRMMKDAQGPTTTDGISLTGTHLQATDRIESQQTGPSAVQLARMQRAAPLCFACGSKTKPDERGRFVCPKCGRTSN